MADRSGRHHLSLSLLLSLSLSLSHSVSFPSSLRLLLSLSPLSISFPLSLCLSLSLSPLCLLLYLPLSVSFFPSLLSVYLFLFFLSPLSLGGPSVHQLMNKSFEEFFLREIGLSSLQVLPEKCTHSQTHTHTHTGTQKHKYQRHTQMCTDTHKSTHKHTCMQLLAEELLPMVFLSIYSDLNLDYTLHFKSF